VAAASATSSAGIEASGSSPSTSFARLLRAPRERIEEVIRLVDLTGQTRQVARTLSGGEFSRASLAVALLGEPALLVLDEPTVDVDPIPRRELRRASTSSLMQARRRSSQAM
jgi:ABC-type multidrug transport system ATPase subunit